MANHEKNGREARSEFLRNVQLPSFVGMFSSGREKPVLNDVRVLESQGGGWAPEQHTGTLVDGRRFYLRIRHGYAQLHVMTAEDCDAAYEREKEAHKEDRWWHNEETSYPPYINPEWSFEEAAEYSARGEEYPLPHAWLGEMVTETVYDEDDGAYLSQEDRDASFKRLLDQILPSTGVYTSETLLD